MNSNSFFIVLITIEGERVEVFIFLSPWEFKSTAYQNMNCSNFLKAISLQFKKIMILETREIGSNIVIVHI